MGEIQEIAGVWLSDTTLDLSTEEQQRALVARARLFLDEAQDLKGVVEVRDQASTIRHHVELRTEGLGARNAASEIVIRAERRAGEALPF